MADNWWPDTLKLTEEDNGTPEQFNEAVRGAGRQAGGIVATATKKDPKKQIPQQFGNVGKIIVGQMEK